MRSIIGGIATIGFALAVWIDRAVGIDILASAVILQSTGTVWAVRLQTTPSLCADSNAISNTNVLNVAAYSHGNANNLVADAAC